MADGIFVPPWLKGVDPGELARLHATGLEIGQRAAAQQNQTLMAMQEAQVRQQEAAMRQQIAQKEIDLEVQKQQAQMEQAQQELALKQQIERREAAVSAMRFAGQKKYEDIVNQMTAAGADPDEARKQALLQSAPLMMGYAPGETLNTMRNLLPQPPPQVKEFPGGKIPPAVMDARGIPHWPPASASAAEFEPKARTITFPDGTVANIAQTGRASGTVVRPSERFEVMEYSALQRRIDRKETALMTAKSNLSALGPDAEKKSPRTFGMYKGQVDELTKSIKEDEARLQELKSKISKAAPAGVSKAKQRTDLANQLAADNPDMTREEIMAEVRKQIP